MKQRILIWLALLLALCAPAPAQKSAVVVDSNTGALVTPTAPVMRSSLGLVPSSGGHAIYVSGSTNATDTRTGLSAYDPARPFATLGAAKTAAASGDVIFVFPGSYNVTASLAKNGVDWYFSPGAAVTLADDIGSEGIWDDGGSAMTFTVAGEGSFTRSTTDDFHAMTLVNCTNTGTVMTIRAQLLNCAAGSDGPCDTIFQSHGTLYVTVDQCISTGGNTYVIYWENGQMHVTAKFISSDYCMATACSTTPEGDMHVTAQEVVCAINGGGTNTAAAAWFRTNMLKSAGGPCINQQGSNRIYVEAQKCFGAATSTAGSGLLYLRADKIAAIQGGAGTSPTLIYVTAGTVRMDVGHLDPVTFGNESVKVTGGSLDLSFLDLVEISTGHGVEVTGGTLRLRRGLIDTSANSSHDPITKSGGTLILYSGVTLIPNSGRNSIAAGTAQNVVNYGYQTKYAKSANVTLKVLTTETVSTDVQ